MGWINNIVPIIGDGNRKLGETANAGCGRKTAIGESLYEIIPSQAIEKTLWWV